MNMETRLALRHIDCLYPGPEQAAPVTKAMLLTDGERILHIGREADGFPEFWTVDTSPYREIDLAGCVVTPGLVNTHHHFYQHLTRAVPGATSSAPLDWLYACYPLWAELDAEMLHAATRAAVAELLLSGCTTAADCAYLLPGDDGVLADALMAGVRETGIRFHFHRGCMPTLEGDLETRLKGIMGERVTRILDEDEDVLFRRLDRVISRYHDPAPGSMCRVALGPTGVTYTRPALMSRLANLAAESDCGLHTHFHPRPDEDEKAAPRKAIDFLAESGWLRPGTWLAHGTRLQPDDVGVLAGSGVGVAHCPRTIVRLGFGVPPISAFRQAGLRLGIGVDGAASNDQGNLLSDLRLAAVLHRTVEGPENWLSPRAALDIATNGGVATLNRTDTGRLETGMPADIAAFRVDGLDCAGATADPLGGLVFAGTEPRAWLTVVNGRVRVEARRLTDLDEQSIAGELNRQARRMLEQAHKRAVA
jgi:cytosine/adenosine deaminase-related metal-dependent hydrolase